MQSIFEMATTMRRRHFRLLFGCDVAVLEVPGSEAAALRASLPAGQQYVVPGCIVYARCNMKYNFRHKRDASPHNNHCDLGDRCQFYFIRPCNAGSLALIISVYRSQCFPPLRNLWGSNFWHTTMTGGRFPQPVLSLCLSPLQVVPVRCVRSASAAGRRARFG